MKMLTKSESAVINVSDKEVVSKNERTFPYSLNFKKAKSKLLKGAKRTKNMDIEIKTTCVNMRFNDGSYSTVVLPMLKFWQKKFHEEMTVNGSVIKIIDVEERMEKSEKHMDTKLVVMFGSSKIVLHASCV